jgi:hypothetical protein
LLGTSSNQMRAMMNYLVGSCNVQAVRFDVSEEISVPISRATEQPSWTKFSHPDDADSRFLRNVGTNAYRTRPRHLHLNKNNWENHQTYTQYLRGALILYIKL